MDLPFHCTFQTWEVSPRILVFLYPRSGCLEDVYVDSSRIDSPLDLDEEHDFLGPSRNLGEDFGALAHMMII